MHRSRKNMGEEIIAEAIARGYLSRGLFA